MKKYAVLSALALASTSSHATSACEVASGSFTQAASMYVKSGAQAFIDRFLQGSPIAEQIRYDGVQKLRQIEHVFGPLQGSSVLSSKGLGERTCYLVATLEYQTGPAFVVIMYYVTKDEPVALSLRLEAEPDKAFSIPALMTKN